jgi:RNA polymerase sigma-70 factor (ECF subfamily)
MPNVIDQLLIDRCISGDRKAQYQLYHQYVGNIFHSVIRIVKHKLEAEDIVQNSFIKIFKHLKYFKGNGNLEGWMKRIAINESLDAIRKSKKAKWISVDAYPMELPTEGTSDWEGISMDSIHKAIKKLPDGCRIVFNLYLLEGYSHKEVAEILRISESTSKTQYRRAKSLLRMTLKTVQYER